MVHSTLQLVNYNPYRHLKMIETKSTKLRFNKKVEKGCVVSYTGLEDVFEDGGSTCKTSRRTAFSSQFEGKWAGVSHHRRIILPRHKEAHQVRQIGPWKLKGRR